MLVLVATKIDSFFALCLFFCVIIQQKRGNNKQIINFLSNYNTVKFKSIIIIPLLIL